jgi:hypothetical protein
MTTMISKSAAAAALLALGALVPGVLRAEAPAWAGDPCAGLDCGAAVAGVGQAQMLPEPAISSAVAYAQAVKSLASALSIKIASNERAYGEGTGEVVDSALKDLADSPLGSALTKTYGSKNSDSISVAIELKNSPDAPRAYVQEAVDAAERTLYVRVVLPRSGAEFALGPGFSVWKPRRIRLSTQDVRVGPQNEFTLWVQDADADLTWVEQWPDGGADLMKNGQVAASYVYDRAARRWTLAPPEIPSGGIDAGAPLPPR